MNLFCFTLDGSTDSIYEPAYSRTVKEAIPKCQCSPALLRHKSKWGGSDPCINSETQTRTAKLKNSNRRSCVTTSTLDNETLDKDLLPTCWTSSSEKKDLSRQKNNLNGGMCKAPCQMCMLTRDDRVEELNSDLTTQSTETEAETAKSLGGLKKLQKLVQGKRGNQSGAKGKSTSWNNDRLADNELSDENPVMTCIGLGKRTEKKPCKTAPSSPQQHKEINEEEEEGLWSPGVHSRHWSCPQPWTASNHTCHQPRHEPWVYGFNFATEWDRFESLIQELNRKPSELSLPRENRSITDLDISGSTSTRCGRSDAFKQHSPLMKPPDSGCLLEQQAETGDPTESGILGRKMKVVSQTVCRRTGKALPEGTSEATERDEAVKGEVGGGRTLTKGRGLASNSLESLCSLNSGQSSSSGVTSGSDCSSNRGSLRLEEDPPYTRQFCGRARVHTEFVPSPYDTESLRLKVGDVIDIIAKPPMGIWTGVLNDRIGNFKFIYVDVLAGKGPETHEKMHRRKPKTLQELLKHLSLEEYSSSLRLNGYRTADDLMGLREQHLDQLNVTDPEHRRRLLAAADALRRPRPDSQLEDGANQEAETIKAGVNNCPRDSGCHMSSDSPDTSKEDAEIHFPCVHTPPAEIPAT